MTFEEEVYDLNTQKPLDNKGFFAPCNQEDNQVVNQEE